MHAQAFFRNMVADQKRLCYSTEEQGRRIQQAVRTGRWGSFDSRYVIKFMKANESQATSLRFFLIFSGMSLFCGCLAAFINEVIFINSAVLQLLTSLFLVILMALWYAVDEDQDTSLYTKSRFFAFGLVVALTMASLGEFSMRALIEQLG
jgi:hypothetical protein